MTPENQGPVTLLPAQVLSLSTMLTSMNVRGAVSITQDGSVLTVCTATTRFRINADGLIFYGPLTY